MFEWQCPHCHKKFYSSYPARSEKMIKCSYCGKEMVNPYYEPDTK